MYVIVLIDMSNFFRLVLICCSSYSFYEAFANYNLVYRLNYWITLGASLA